MTTRHDAQRYLDFIRSINPQAADRAVERVNSMAGLGQVVIGDDEPVQDSSTFDSLIQAARDAASALIGIEQQRRLLEINAQRAAQGLPLIDTLAAQVQVGLAPDIKNLLVIGGLFFAGIFVLYTVMGKRR